jgi:tRNA U54 and U55 pseudouridine synthase Pus10
MSDWSFETLAASLRADVADLKTFHEVLAEKLAQALGQSAVEVKRSGFRWQAERPLTKLSVNFGDIRLEAERASLGMSYKVTKLVRGVALKSDLVSLEVWLEALSKALWAHAAANEHTRQALEQFLLDE